MLEFFTIMIFIQLLFLSSTATDISQTLTQIRDQLIALDTLLQIERKERRHDRHP